MDSLSSYRNSTQSWLTWFLRGVLLILFLVLLAKMFEVQIIKGAYYRKLSEENRVRHIPIPAPRGRILARGGEALADNIKIQKRINFKTSGGYEITSDLTNATPEEIITDYKRSYPLGAGFAHASGYLSKVNDAEINKVDPNCPERGPRESGMLVGTTGLEEQYECQLLGIPGEELIEVNTFGHKIRSIGRRDPVPGADIKTTIDYNLQTETAREMEGKIGAAIVTEPKGQILAFYSGPSFDPNILIDRTDQKQISSLLNSADLPFFNREISGTFHPGSVFKPVVAISALQEKAIDSKYLYNDQGVINVNTFSYSNWYFSEFGRTEGEISLIRAIARSTDTFFYKIGEMVGPDAIAKWSQKFGLDKKTGIDLPGEKEGLIPTPEWKKRVTRESWFLGNTYHMAIGQGDVSVTPIEINTYIASIANEGILCTPHLLQKDSKCRQIEVKRENLDLVKEGMKEACSTGGTAYTFFDFAQTHGGIQVACKTGTAEVGTDGTPHAWFTLMAPMDKPEIITTILIERGGQGSQVAGPIARKIMDFYFQGLATSN
ncbi:MAG TPA: penicillin-binding transpeptidase domain-containing protein [Patescibacteria group bacterium]|nr:penicillin-binding transpeptidase domain-containing protein [Patescibacteria group bacterium]